MRTEVKKFKIMAGMKFNYLPGGTCENAIKQIGEYTMKFIYNEENQLISETKVKQLIY